MCTIRRTNENKFLLDEMFREIGHYGLFFYHKITKVMAEVQVYCDISHGTVQVTGINMLK